MSNLYVLLKNSFINNTGINSLSRGISSSKEKKKLLFTSIMLIFAAALIIFMSTSYSIGVATVLRPMGYLDLVLIIAVIASVILSFITSIYKAQGTLFSAKDYDLLMALPIKDSTILSSKIISMMAINYIGTTLILLPASVVYFIYNGTLSWTYFLVLLIGLIFVPMIPIIGASIVAIIITFISSRFKYKNLATTIVGLIFFLLIMIVSLNAQNYINSFIENSESIVSGISRIYPPALYLKDSLVSYNLISLIKFIGISLIPFIIFIWIFSKSFKSINGKLGESFKRANYKVNKLETSTPLKALVTQEIRRYFATPIYVLNTAFGMVLLLAAAVATLFINPKQFAILLGYPGMENLLPMIILAFLIFAIGLSCTTNSSISLEGNRLWILKSLPIDPKGIFKGKILMNLIITIPIAIISNILFFIGLEFEIKDLIFNLTLSIIFAIISSIMGLLINLYFPKLEWSNPTVVVKQSASVMISMVFTFGIVALGVITFLLLKINNMTMFLSIITVVLLTLEIIMWRVLTTEGVKKFTKL